jgi:hypothetical protein
MFDYFRIELPGFFAVALALCAVTPLRSGTRCTLIDLLYARDWLACDVCDLSSWMRTVNAHAMTLCIGLSEMPQQRPSLFRWREIPGSVWILGLVSMFMDVSSEMIHALLPLYLVTVLGASTLTVGIIEGIAEATASITKIFSGALSDYLGKRKWLAAFGYGLAAVTKPVFPLASGIGWLTAARFHRPRLARVFVARRAMR